MRNSKQLPEKMFHIALWIVVIFCIILLVRR